MCLLELQIEMPIENTLRMNIVTRTFVGKMIQFCFQFYMHIIIKHKQKFQGSFKN